MIALLVGLGAAVGAPARYLTDRAVMSRYGGRFPWATLAVNVVASFVLGLVAGAAGGLSVQAQAFVGTGVCGALSTFSTFSYETVRLAQDGLNRVLVAYLGASVLLAVAAAAFGWSAAS